MKILILKFFVLIINLQMSLSGDDEDWDYLLFVQRWPMSACDEWQEKSPENNCSFPMESQLWTVHGIWPTKIHSQGPNFCNSSWHYNATLIEPLLPDLEEYWTNIEANTKLSSLWRHEWEKHGTCVSQLDCLHGPENYFKQGIALAKEYSIGNILLQKNVIPTNEGYNITYIHDCFVSVLKVNPIIQCVVAKDTKQSLISEIRLCLNKSLQLIDCDTRKTNESNGSVLITNCNLKKPIMYLPNLPNGTILHEEIIQQSKYVDKLVEIYYSLQFLIWLTF